MTKALVFGGGVAGITAAFRLRDQGHEVELLESHGWLGGRAFSRADEHLGIEIDNGPHVVLGCYDEFRALLRRIGTESGFAKDALVRGGRLALRLRRADGTTSELTLGPRAIGFPGTLGFGARARLLLGAVCARRGARADETLVAWLARRWQRGAPARTFWEPLCRAMMNADPARVSAALFLATVQRSLASGAEGMAIWVPRLPWSKLVGEPAHLQLAREGVRVTLGARLTAIEIADGRARALAQNDVHRALDAETLVVLALPWHALQPLLGARVPAHGASPITSVHFAGLELPDEGPLVVLEGGTPFHFVCRRSGAPSDRFALLSGGETALGGTEVAAIERAAREQLTRHYPGIDTSRGRARVTKEARATALFSPTEARARLAPGRLDGIANLVVCGDATATGLPSTLEGAALSARLALP